MCTQRWESAHAPWLAGPNVSQVFETGIWVFHVGSSAAYGSEEAALIPPGSGGGGGEEESGEGGAKEKRSRAALAQAEGLPLPLTDTLQSTFCFQIVSEELV